jgi:hypothetical protein
VLLCVTSVAACAGTSRPPRAAAPATPPHDAALDHVRGLDARFTSSPGGADDFASLSAALATDRPRLAHAGRAEADLILTLASARVLADALPALADPRAPEHDLVAATVLPRVYDVRPLDGELPPALRDRICQDHGAGACRDVLPDYWGAALAYQAAQRLRADMQEETRDCACADRYSARTAALVGLSDRAAQLEQAARPGWDLAHDPLARSALAEPLAGPPPAALTLGLHDRPPPHAPGGPGALRVELRADDKAADLRALAAAAAGAGYTSIYLEVRSAAAPNPRALLHVELVRGRRAPKGSQALVIRPKDRMQVVVDQIDGALVAAGKTPPRVVLLTP